MDFLGWIAQALGDAVNGILQVIADFINLIIDILPNPDPFPEIINGLTAETAANLGFARFWIDAFIGIDNALMIIGAWAVLMGGAAVFAVVYWVVKAIKP